MKQIGLLAMATFLTGVTSQAGDSADEKEPTDWMLKGQCTEACTSPPVCPAYWSSPLPKDLHDGKSQCESVWSFHIQNGYYGKTNLGGLNASIAFNIPPGFPENSATEKWPSIIYIDQRANDSQTKAIEQIFRVATAERYRVISVKRAAISFTKELVNGGPAAKHSVKIDGVYEMAAQPLMTPEGKPRQINTRFGGTISIGKSETNRFQDTDLPRTWDRPGMTNTYLDFSITPTHLHWLP
jgi:hypothetical protein